MRRFRVRLRVGRMMIAVALIAGGLAVWAAWFDPTRRWQRAINDDQNGALRWEALRQLAPTSGAPIDHATALLTLTGALRSPSFRIRETAVMGLGRLGPAAKPAVKALLATCADPRPYVAAAAARQLSAILLPTDPDRAVAVPTLTGMLGDRSPQVRLGAAMTLAEMGYGTAALPVLIETLRGGEYLAQGEALWAIGQIGPPARAALPEVVALQGRVEAADPADYSRYLRIYAPETRCHLGDQAAGLAALRAVRDGADPDLAREARRVLAKLPQASEIDPEGAAASAGVSSTPSPPSAKAPTP